MALNLSNTDVALSGLRYSIIERSVGEADEISGGKKALC
jgi:hypothetical protein